MTANVGMLDKWIRIALGLGLMIWAATGGPAWAWIGIVPLLTGVFRFCVLYRLLGINSCGARS